MMLSTQILDENLVQYVCRDNLWVESVVISELKAWLLGTVAQRDARSCWGSTGGNLLLRVRRHLDNLIIKIAARDSGIDDHNFPITQEEIKSVPWGHT